MPPNPPTRFSIEPDFHSQKGKSDTKVIIRDRNTKEKVEIDCTRIWGFSYKGQLFRVMRKGKYLEGEMDNFPVILSKHNGAFYWLNGMFLYALKKGQNSAQLHGSYTALISATVDGEAMLVTGLMKGPGWVQKNGDQFFKDHPELAWIEACSKRQIKKGYLHGYIEGCIDNHVEPSE